MTRRTPADPDALTVRAEQLVKLLRSALPATAAVLAFRETDDAPLRSLYSWGYPEGVAEFLTGRFVRDDPAIGVITGQPTRVLFWEDVDGFRDGATARDVLLPHGYHDGSTLVFLDADSALAGVVHVSLGRGGVPSNARPFLAHLRPELAPTLEGACARARWRLTPREVEVLTLVAASLTNTEIASRLGIRRRTVATHVENILHKLGAGSRLAAVTTAFSAGVLPLGASALSDHRRTTTGRDLAPPPSPRRGKSPLP